jgi:acetolactate synthase-1/2/3 large subunit
MGFQEIPITAMARPITKEAITVSSSKQVLESLPRLVQLAKSGRPGPVWLDVPLDVQNEPIPSREVVNGDFHFSRKRASTKKLRDAVGGLVKELSISKRPVLLVGNGVRLSNTSKFVYELIHTLKIPTLLTWKMADFLDDQDPLNAGRPGSIPQPWSNIIQQEADFLLSLGARIDTGQSAYNLSGFAPDAKKFIVDVDPAELAKFQGHGRYAPINADLEIFLPALEKNTSNLVSSSVSWNPWKKRLSQLKNGYINTFYNRPSPSKGINLYNLVALISKLLPKDALVVPGSSGACSEISMQAFKIKLGQRLYNSEGLGPMGFAIPAAIGAVVASAGKRVISIDGDGGFLMNIQELASVKLHADNVVFFVLNNNGYGSIKNTQDKLFEGRRLGTDPSTGLALANLQKIADTFDFNYFLLASESDMEREIEEVFAARGSSIVEVMVEKDQKTSPRVVSNRNKLGHPLPANMSHFE